MKHRFHLMALAAAMLAGGGVTAAAQVYPAQQAYPPAPAQPMLGPQHADAIVRSLGLAPVSRAEARGPVFVVHALGQEGTQVQVTLDRHSGRVMQIVRVGYGAPRIASVPLAGGPLYDPEDGEDDFAAFDGDLPPPGVGPHVVTREGDITGSVRAPVDPLIGVPKEFRRREARPAAPQQPQRTAARAAEPAPRAAPLPRPRPADAPAAVEPEQVPDAQGFE